MPGKMRDLDLVPTSCRVSSLTCRWPRHNVQLPETGVPRRSKVCHCLVWLVIHCLVWLGHTLPTIDECQHRGRISSGRISSGEFLQVLCGASWREREREYNTMQMLVTVKPTCGQISLTRPFYLLFYLFILLFRHTTFTCKVEWLFCRGER